MAAHGSVPVVAVVGWAGSGKTTVIERLIPALKKRGVERIGVVKHTHHAAIDTPGKDTDRLRQAGAAVVGLVGARGTALFCYGEEEGTGLEGLLALMAALGPFDLLLLEGFKGSRWPKIEVVRQAVSTEVFSPPEELLAVVADIPPSRDVPWLAFGEEEKLAALLLDWLHSQQGQGEHKGK